LSLYGRDGSLASDPAARGRDAVAQLPSGLASLPRTELPLFDRALLGADALRSIFGERSAPAPVRTAEADSRVPTLPSIGALIPEMTRSGRGVVMAMGKGGVGKTSAAVAIAVALARRGHAVHLTTTDPAAHVEDALGPASVRA
jgi:arsenite-transporting ATPase